MICILYFNGLLYVRMVSLVQAVMVICNAIVFSDKSAQLGANVQL